MRTLRELLKGDYSHLTKALELLYVKHEEVEIVPEGCYNRGNIEWLYLTTITELVESDVSDPVNKVVISKVPVDDFNDSEYYDISIIPDVGDRRSLEFIKWFEIIDAEIVLECEEVPASEIIFLILWEMTLHGFTEDDRAKSKKLSEKILKSIIKEKYGK